MVEKQCYDAFRHSDEKDAIQKLKKMKGDPREMKYWYSTTILHFAAYRGWLEAVQLLITEYQFDPSCSNHYKTTPLHWSSEYGHPNIVKYLITECNCDPNCKNWNNETPLYLAKHPQDITRHEGHDRVVEYLESLTSKHLCELCLVKVYIEWVFNRKSNLVNVISDSSSLCGVLFRNSA